MKNLAFSALFVATILLSTSCTDELICVQGSGSSTTQVYNLPAFDRLSVSIPADVKIFKDTIQSVAIVAQSNILSEIEVVVINGELFITRDRCVVPYVPIEVAIHMPSVKAVELAGSGNIKGYGTFQSNVFDCEVSGSGNIDFFLESTTVLAKITGSGNIQLNGSAENQDLEITGSGNMELFGLTTNNTDIELNGSGNCEVYAEETLDVDITGSGNVYYKGNPQISANISGSGSLINAN